MSVKSKIAREYCQRFPKHGDHTLAAKMYKENKLVFDSTEHARDSIRYVRGHIGNRNRKLIADKSDTKPVTRNSRPYDLPESYAEPKEPFVLPKACNNILLISDLHAPYHDNTAISVALDYGKEKKINTVVINGDLIDFHMLSRFEKDPRKRSVKQEFDTAKDILRVIRKTFPTAKIYWILGNHDKRYEKWLMAKAPEIFDDPYYSMEERLRLNEERIEVINDLQLVRAGKLFITHGHTIVRGVFAPVNSARGAFMKAKMSVIIGHTHQVSFHPEKRLDGDLIGCWSQGCLCELSPDYDPHTNKHQHGFARVVVNNDGSYTVENKMIINGKLF